MKKFVVVAGIVIIGLSILLAESQQSKSIHNSSLDYGLITQINKIDQLILQFNPNIKFFEQVDLITYIIKYSNYHNVCGGPLYTAAIGAVESGFEKNAVSHCGATGYLQLSNDWSEVGNRFDPLTNIYWGTYFLGRLTSRYGNYRLVASAYNAGPGRVKNSVPEIPETQAYQARVMSIYYRLAGIYPVDIDPNLTYLVIDELQKGVLDHVLGSFSIKGYISQGR